MKNEIRTYQQATILITTNRSRNHWSQLTVDSLRLRLLIQRVSFALCVNNTEEEHSHCPGWARGDGSGAVIQCHSFRKRKNQYHTSRMRW